MKGVFDTNIVVDYMNDHEPASETIAAHDDKVISRVTWMEVLVGAVTAEEESRIREQLSRFRIVELTPDIAERAVVLRRTHLPKLKLPDATIYATARQERCDLITRNTNDFPADAADVTVPYTI